MKYKKSAVILFATVFTLLITTFYIHGNSHQDTLTHRSTLLTSHDASRWAKFTADGDMVYAEGYYADDSVIDFYISAANLHNAKQEFKQKDGSFTASYSGSCNSSYGYVILKFQSGNTLSYRIEYKNGWFFGDNGLAVKNNLFVEENMTADSETSAYYVTEDLDIDKTRSALDEIRSIALEITSDLNDDYEKAKALNYWVAENIYYDEDAFNAGVGADTIALFNVITKRRTVCGGYANLYAAMLEAVGIKSVNVKGGVVAEECMYEDLLTKTVVHEWVAFWYEKESRWVVTDPGWDSSNTYNNGEFNQKPHGIKYFDIDGYAFSLNHRADKAELREYFSAVEFLQNYSQEIITEVEKPSENQILIQETTENTTRNSVESPKSDVTDFSETNNDKTEEDNSLLIAAVLIMSAGVVLITVVIIRAVKKNK